MDGLASRRILAESGEAICVPTQDWNGAAFALHAVGIDCVVTDANNIPDEEK